jgi:uncharacterized membrane-anchored protein YitT (DUF2179 family)
MKSRIQVKRYILIVVLVVLISFSISLAFFVYRNYAVIARGVSGIALLFLLFFFGKRSKLDISFEDLLLDPQKSKYLISALVVPLLSWFAFAQIYEMILFFLK